jgi:hypothetical protein
MSWGHEMKNGNVDKCIKTFLSCSTCEQFANAISFFNLLLKNEKTIQLSNSSVLLLNMAAHKFNYRFYSDLTFKKIV